MPLPPTIDELRRDAVAGAALIAAVALVSPGGVALGPPISPAVVTQDNGHWGVGPFGSGQRKASTEATL
jgi:hypothetical protein